MKSRNASARRDARHTETVYATFECLESRLLLSAAPVVTTTATALDYHQVQLNVPVDPALTVTDSGSTTIADGTVSIVTNFAGVEDVLAFTSQNGITGSYDSATGILTLTGTATVAQYQSALDSVTYSDLSASPSTLARTIEFAVNDGTNPSNAADRAVNFTADVAPVVTTTATPLAYQQGQLQMAADPTLTVADADSANLSSATVSLTTGFVTGEDVLAFTNQNGITGSYNATTGVLTLTGSATIAQYQAALQSVTYSDLSATPTTSDRTVEFVVNDGIDNSAPADRTINFTADAAPTVTTTAIAGTYVQSLGPVVIDPGVTLADADSPNLTGATVAISANFDTAGDVLNFTSQNGITGSYDSSTGILTLTGTATLAQYQTALQSVTYQDTTVVAVASRTFTFTVTDGILTSAGADRTLNISADAAPVVTTTGTPLAYQQALGAAVVDPGITVTDSDTSNLTGATVTITANFVAGDDVLAFTNQNGITGSYDGSTGILTLTGSSSVANYQAALQSITFDNTNPSTSTLTRTVTFTVSDGTLTGAGTRDITFQADAAPVVTPTPTPLDYQQSAGATSIDTGLTVTDADSPNLTGAVVWISGNYVNGEDVLAFTDMSGITGSWDPSTGSMTLSGTATVLQYQVAIHTITYNDASMTPSVLARTVSFTVNDGLLTSAEVSRDINFTIDAAPVVTTTATALTYYVVQGATVIDPGVTITDADNTTLQGAMVEISGNFDSTQDVLAFVNQNGITGTFHDGIMSLTGTATVAQFMAAMASVTYQNTSGTPTVLTRVISFGCYDGVMNSNLATRTINIQSDIAPVIITSPYYLRYVQNDGYVVVDPSITVTDVDSANLAGVLAFISGNYRVGEDFLSVTNQPGIVSHFDASTGSLYMNGTASVATWQLELRSVTYISSLTPNADARTVTFRAYDGYLLSADASRIVVLVPLRVDLYEANNYSWQSTVVPLSDRGAGLVPNATIDPGTDVDWFSFTVPYGANGNVLVTAGNVGGGLLAHVGIYDSIIASTSDLYGGIYATLYGPKATADATLGNQAVTASWTGLVPGQTYYVKVSSIASTTGIYDLGVTCFMTTPQDAFEPNNTSATASDVTSSLVASGGNLSLPNLSIDNGNDVDWFRVVAPQNADGNMTVTISGLTNGLAGTLYAYQQIAHVPSPVLMAGNVFASYITGGTSQVTLYSVTPGATYFIRVDNFLNETGGYQLAVSLPLDQQVKDAYEGGAGNNQSWLAAPLLPIGGPFAVNSLTIHNWNDQDWFSFTTNAAGAATITVSGVTGGLMTHVGLYASPVGTLSDLYGGIFTTLYGPLGVNDATLPNQTVVLTVPGLHAFTTYYVKVSGDDLTTGLYSLGISVV